jgi:UDP-glucose 4-epimerase
MSLNKTQTFITALVNTVLGRQEELRLFGTDYNTKDGTCIRDFIHIEDLAKAHVKALEFLFTNEEAKVEILNIGTGTGYSLLEVTEECEQIIGRKVNTISAPRRPGDIMAIYADNKKALEVLGWRSAKTIGEIVETALTWEKSFMN